MLLDTNIIIDLFRGYPPAITAFENFLYSQKASVMTKMELIGGEKTRKDAKRMIEILDNLRINFLPITEKVCAEAENIILNYHHRQSIGILDSFIAATAIIYDEELATRNVKHFEFIPNLKLIAPY